MLRPRLSLVAILATAGALLIGAADASARSMLTHGCPPTYRAEGTQSTFQPSRVDKARRGTFHLQHGFWAHVHPGMNWRKVHYHSANYLHSLYDLSWLDALVWAYHDPKDRYSEAEQIQALHKARDLAWIWVNAEQAGKVQHKIAWSDRIVARRAEYIAYVAKANACRGDLSGEQSRGFLTALGRYDRFLRHAQPDVDNHRLSVQMALAILGKQLPTGKIARAGRQASRKFHRAFHHGLDESSGVWLENSPGYFDFALRLVSTWLGAVDSHDRDLKQARHKMHQALAWLTSTSGTEAQIGDTFQVPPIPQVGATAYGQNGLWVARHAGYAAVKDQSTGGYLVVSSSFHTWHHKHADDTGFELYDRNQAVVADTGEYDNTKGRYARFERSAAAHSVMTVDGQDFLWFWNKHRYKPKPYGSGILAAGSGDGWYAILATNPMLHRQGVTQDRLFLYDPTRALVVYDMVDSSHTHRYTRYFQLGPHVSTSKASGSDLTLAGAGTVSGLENWAGTHTGPAKVVRGREHPLAGWTYPKLHQKEARDTVSWTSRAKSMRAAAIFALGGSQLSLAGVTGAVGGLPRIGLSDGTTLDVSRSGHSLSVSVGG
jgi:hypothetical protein